MHAHLASTQDMAIHAARAGDPGRLAVLASVQSAGRGSRGRTWIAPAGNLNLSVLLRPAGARPNPGYWSLLAGVALHDALASHTGGLMLKWPNDVLLDGAKLGGVLIETGLRPDGLLDWVVIGFGANLAEAPAVDGRATACLPPPPPDAREVAESVLSSIDACAGTDVRAAWLARGHGLGTAIDVATPQRRISGRFAGLTMAGELLLDGDPQPISSAEIFLSSRASEGLEEASLHIGPFACCSS